MSAEIAKYLKNAEKLSEEGLRKIQREIDRLVREEQRRQEPDEQVNWRDLTEWRRGVFGESHEKYPNIILEMREESDR